MAERSSLDSWPIFVLGPLPVTRVILMSRLGIFPVLPDGLVIPVGRRKECRVSSPATLSLESSYRPSSSKVAIYYREESNSREIVEERTEISRGPTEKHRIVS
ncbi:hypothetical protein FRC14_005627 [Serendipita sp. 396]|nr:hypothetical protein FRC14_005627 [Serendipita sp. 396]KAG8781369.1 hypothetical protein FRC15_008827 [Serendipita sp. 397]KAG8799192.1 hypothetical protein FRC16_005609 [Serendipita sp. 398]